jgi:hypothetical protein
LLYSLTLKKYLVNVRGAGRVEGCGVEVVFEGAGGFEREKVSLSYSLIGNIT